MPNLKNPNTWHVPDLRSQACADQLIAKANETRDKPLILDFSNTRAVYPNGAVPFARNLAFIRDSGRRELVITNIDPTIEDLLMPLALDDYKRNSGTHLTHSVWRYESEQEAQRLTNMFTEAITDRVACEEGVIDSITWCLYEVLDNVFQHSQAQVGYVMMQLHRDKRLCAIAVGDSGIGIQKSLALTKSAPIDVLRDPSLAIGHALQQGVTSKGGENQGNGLYGLRRAVEINGGQLNVRSGWGYWSLRDGEIDCSVDRHQPLLHVEDHQSTLVDWQLDCSRKVRIDEALGSRKPSSSELLETIEGDDGLHRISVMELEESLGSRKLGADIRTRLQNFLSAGASFVVLDFKGVGVISSSFADEVLAKLAVEMGELEFRRRVFVESVSPTNRSLIETAINLRIQSSERPPQSN